ncbi:MAG: YceI family protein [Mycobacteriales bacterium]|nr:YceI family protein [Mycobacteriales bacterium]
MTAPTTVLAPSDLSGSYALDPTHTRIGFVARHAMVTKVRGQFTDYTADVVLDFENPANSSANVVIQVVSVDTGNAQRDEHLRTNDFFDAPTFPTITFTSTGVKVVDSETFQLVGDLTIKGISKPVTVDFELSGTAKDPWGGTRAGFDGKAVINRSDWGVSFNAALETGGVLVSDKITLEFDLSAVKQ